MGRTTCPISLVEPISKKFVIIVVHTSITVWIVLPATVDNSDAQRISYNRATEIMKETANREVLFSLYTLVNSGITLIEFCTYT